MAAVESSPRTSTEDEYEGSVPVHGHYDEQSALVMRKKSLKHFSFDYEPSKVETQLKENIQRLNTPSEEKEIIGTRQDSGYRSSSAMVGGITRGITLMCKNNGGLETKVVTSPEISSEDDWEIPFQDIRDLEFVGSGGQGTVFKGVYRGKMVAVKKVNDLKQTKIQHLRKLHHDNIIKFLGVSTKDPCYCVIMEYCSGGNVYQYMRKPNTLLLPRRVFNWARQIANGMNYLHSNRIIHRDLKSLNVLVQKEKSLKITDFGTCRTVGNHSTVMTVVGSCAWMAPEMIRNEPCNDRVDVWSYGILLWELLTKEVPYKGLNHGAIMFGVGSNRLSLPIPGKCPSEMKNLLNQCWQPKAKNRPSFRQILDQLDSVREGRFLTYTPQDYLTMREGWRKEIDTHFDSLELSLNDEMTEDHQLVIKRKEELKHAQEVRKMYERKLETAERLCDQLDHSKRLIDQRQHELDRWERELNEKLEEYRALCGGSSSSSDDESGFAKTVVVRRRRSVKRSTRGGGVGRNSTPDVFDSPATSSPILCHASFNLSGNCTATPFETKPRSYSSPTNNSSKRSDLIRSDSIITDEGKVASSVKKLMKGVDSTLMRKPHPLQPGHHHHTVYLHRSTHRRVKSCSSQLSGIRRRGSIKSLNFSKRSNHNSHDHLSHDHMSPDNYHSLNSTDGDNKRHRPLLIVRSHSATTASPRGSPDTSVWNNNGEDGDTESNGEEGEQDDDVMGDEPLSSEPTSPMGPPNNSTTTGPIIMCTNTSISGSLKRGSKVITRILDWAARTNIA